jgi:hypothetical protein
MRKGSGVPPPSSDLSLATARKVAVRVLSAARSDVTDAGILTDIDEAISRASEIEPSEFFAPSGEALASTLHSHRDNTADAIA